MNAGIGRGAKILDACGLRLMIFPDVYEPAEDSMLLAGCAAKLKGRVLDMGCGSGLVGLACAKGSPENRVVCADLNQGAVENARANAEQNRIANVEFVLTDLFSKIKKEPKFDAIVFNPPYLPTAENERVRGKLNLAFDGGKNGRKVTDRFLAAFPRFLKKDGKLLLVESSLAGIEKTVAKLGGMGFGARILGEEKFFFERIVVIEAKRRSGKRAAGRTN